MDSCDTWELLRCLAALKLKREREKDKLWRLESRLLDAAATAGIAVGQMCLIQTAVLWVLKLGWGEKLGLCTHINFVVVSGVSSKSVYVHLFGFQPAAAERGGHFQPQVSELDTWFQAPPPGPKDILISYSHCCLLFYRSVQNTLNFLHSFISVGATTSSAQGLLPTLCSESILLGSGN